MHKHKEKKEVEKPQRRPQRRKWCTKAFHTTSPRRASHIGGLSGKRRSSKSNDTWDPCHVTIKQKKTPRKSTKIVFLVSYSSVACNATCTNKIPKLHERQVICVREWEEASSTGASPTRGLQASHALQQMSQQGQRTCDKWVLEIWSGSNRGFPRTWILVYESQCVGVERGWRSISSEG